VETTEANPSNVELRFRRLAGGLNSPVSLASPKDGTGRIFILEKRGVIKVWNGERIRSVPYLDISGRVNSGGGEQGLLGMAFHPDFKTNRFFFIAYTDGQGDLRIVRFRAGKTYKVNTAKKRTHKIVLQVSHRKDTLHNGGQLQFGSKLLFISTGDGGGTGDPDGNAQNTKSLLGKILRINVDRRCGDRLYCSPSGNPFVGKTGRNQIWHYGLRNPWRFSMDRKNGAMWIADVGDKDWEEVNRVGATAKAVNFGWDCREGLEPYEPNNSYCSGATFRDPISVYANSSGRCAVIGGYVYRGKQDPELRGIYPFADHCSGEVWGIGRSGGTWKRARIGTAPGNLSSFGERAGNGKLFAVTLQGNLYRVRARPT
jgi:glucose/arabinose dehydrogenase